MEAAMATAAAEVEEAMAVPGAATEAAAMATGAAAVAEAMAAEDAAMADRAEETAALTERAYQQFLKPVSPFFFINVFWRRHSRRVDRKAKAAD
jgi:hypothetical protein